jgi:small subunit ribosomal protein S21
MLGWCAVWRKTGVLSQTAHRFFCRDGCYAAKKPHLSEKKATFLAQTHPIQSCPLFFLKKRILFGFFANKNYLCSPVLTKDNFHQKRSIFMLILEVKDGEVIDKVLKKYKRKFEKAGILKELRRRKAYTKPSVSRRTEVLKAVYKEDMYGNKND